MLCVANVGAPGDRPSTNGYLFSRREQVPAISQGVGREEGAGVRSWGGSCWEGIGSQHFTIGKTGSPGLVRLKLFEAEPAVKPYII